MYHGMFSPTVGIQLLKTLNEDGSNLQMINDRLFVCLFVFDCDQVEFNAELFQNVLPLYAVVLLQCLVE